MQGKITLVTPPDIYENSNPSLLFIHLNDADQDAASQWLANKTLADNVNFYMYNGEPNVPWILWAMGACQYKYIDLDSQNNISQPLSGYLLGKADVYYKTVDENLAAVCSHINNNRVARIESFLERALGE
jgi:hypothetical protein